jgi:cell division protein FtsB
MSWRGPARLAARVALETAPPQRGDRKAGILVGRDFARERRAARSALHAALPYLVGAAVAIGLAIAALRNDLIRMRYDLTAAMREERELLQERRELTARVRELRDPARLAELARERGFVRPERVFELEPPGGAAR